MAAERTLWRCPAAMVFSGRQRRPKSGDKLAAALKGVAANSKVNTVFNTHYHLDQTGNNELFSAAGAKIIAHDRTRQWMANEYWIPEEMPL